jgi:phage shock protein PspC (stress-responsive transcriptional regulator)
MDETNAPAPEPTPEPAPQPEADAAPPRPPRLTRHPTDKVVAGVAGGLGHYFGIDPIVFRLAFVAFTILGGGGILLYLLAWIAMPVAAPGEPVARRGTADVGPWLGLGLVVIATLWLSGLVFHWRPSVVAALVLLAGGVLLFQHSERRGTGVLPHRDASGASLISPPDATAASVGGAATVPLGPEPGIRRERSVLGRATLALMLLGVAGLGLLEAAGALRPRTGDYAALALAVIGAGLVVGAWRGRARWLIPLGLVLVPCLMVASLVPGQLFRDGRGDVLEQPASVADLRPVYGLGAGSLTLDLRGVQVPRGASPVVRAEVGMGQLTVLVAPDARVAVRAESGFGRVQLFNREEGGFNPDLQVTAPGSGGTLELDLRVGMGEVVVSRLGDAFIFGPPRPLHPLRPPRPMTPPWGYHRLELGEF